MFTVYQDLSSHCEGNGVVYNLCPIRAYIQTNKGDKRKWSGDGVWNQDTDMYGVSTMAQELCQLLPCELSHVQQNSLPYTKFFSIFPLSTHSSIFRSSTVPTTLAHLPHPIITKFCSWMLPIASCLVSLPLFFSLISPSSFHIVRRVNSLKGKYHQINFDSFGRQATEFT